MKPLASLLAATGLVVQGALAPVRSMAEPQSGFYVRDGIAVYYAIVPAEVIRRFPKNSPEAGMHGGVPSGRNVHHVMVALFDAASLERIVDARVRATVAEVGLAHRLKALEPFMSNGAVSYCNYFRLSPRTDYRIQVDIRRPAAPDPSRLEITYRR